MKRNLSQREQHVLTMPELPRLRGSATYVYLYLCHEEIIGKRATVGEVQAILSRLSFYSVARIIALLNSGCCGATHQDFTNNPQFQAKLAISFFDSDWRRRISDSRWGKHQCDCVIFHRQQLLFLLDLAIESCPIEEGLTWDTEARHLFGIACLMVNDLLAKKKTSTPSSTSGKPHSKSNFLSEDEKWDNFATALPSIDFDWDKTPRNHFGRSWTLWVELAQSDKLRERAGKEWVDWAVAFEAKHKLGLIEFLSIAQALSFYVALANPSDNKSDRYLIFDPYAILEQTNVSRSQIDVALSLLCRNVEDLKEESLNGRHRRGWDMTLLRRFPLIELDKGVVVAFDAILLFKAATEGVYYLLQEAVGDKFGNMFGHVYDAYIERIWRRIIPENSSPKLPRFHPRPMWCAKDKISNNQITQKKNDEVCDGMVNCEPRLVFAEVKASLLTPHAKYSGNKENLKKDLDGKFALKTGAAQLARKIRRLIEGERPCVPGFNFQAFERIFPILISYDTAPSTPLLCGYLNEAFQSELGKLPKSRLKVGKLVVLSSYEMEALEAVCLHVPLTKVLMKFQQQCPSDMSFRVFLQGNYIEFFHSETRISVADAFNSSGDAMARVLFNESSMDEAGKHHVQEKFITE